MIAENKNCTKGNKSVQDSIWQRILTKSVDYQEISGPIQDSVHRISDIVKVTSEKIYWYTSNNLMWNLYFYMENCSKIQYRTNIFGQIIFF